MIAEAAWDVAAGAVRSTGLLSEGPISAVQEVG